LFGVGVAVALSLYALRQNIDLFYSPTQVVNGKAPLAHEFRLGGLVKKGSVHTAENGLAVTFVLTDNLRDVPVLYRGILPDLFRGGQGIVAEGTLNNKHQFIADRVLAKHDANYMPPNVKAALKEAADIAQGEAMVSYSKKLAKHHE